MSRLYIRVMTGFYSHRKTVRLRSKLGMDALWLPPRIWAYCAENQPDGNLSGYEPSEIAMLAGYLGDATSMLQALKDCGFIDKNGFVHDWEEHNGYHEKFSQRAKVAAAARWSKKEEKEIGNRKVESGDKHCLEHALSILPTPKKMADGLVNEMKVCIGAAFKRGEHDFWHSGEEHRLFEVCQRPDVKAEWIELLAFRVKPESYFPQKIGSLLEDWTGTLDRARNHKEHNATNGRTGKTVDRNAGTYNAGKASQYANVGKRPSVELPDAQSGHSGPP